MKAANKEQILPKVGMAATKTYFSDSQAAKVLSVISYKKIIVGYYNYPSWGEDRQVSVTGERIDDSYEPEIWTLRKSGIWRQEGKPDKFGECFLTLGKAYSYRSMND